jgi:methyl-accepting chemotaxis protein
MTIRRVRLSVLAVVLAVLCGGVGCATSESESEQTFKRLAGAKERMDAVDEDITAIEPEQPVTPASIMEYFETIERELPRYVPIKEEIDQIQEDAQGVEDQDVTEAAHLLASMIEQRYGRMREVASSVKDGEVNEEESARLAEITAQVDEANEQFRVIAVRLNERYG